MVVKIIQKDSKREFCFNEEREFDNSDTFFSPAYKRLLGRGNCTFCFLQFSCTCNLMFQFSNSAHSQLCHFAQSEMQTSRVTSPLPFLSNSLVKFSFQRNASTGLPTANLISFLKFVTCKRISLFHRMKKQFLKSADQSINICLMSSRPTVHWCQGFGTEAMTLSQEKKKKN